MQLKNKEVINIKNYKEATLESAIELYREEIDTFSIPNTTFNGR